jgi:hypothetical protein
MHDESFAELKTVAVLLIGECPRTTFRNTENRPKRAKVSYALNL